jgi:hypothetical protein
VLIKADIISSCVPPGNGLLAISSAAALLFADPSVANNIFMSFVL